MAERTDLVQVEDYLRVLRAIRGLVDPKKRPVVEPLLLDYGSEAVPPLIQALRDPDPELACAAARILGEIGDPRSIDPLARAGSREEPLVAAAAVAGLGRIPNPEAVAPLSEALDSDRPAIRLEAALGLAQLGVRPSEQAQEALECLQPRDVSALCTALLTRLGPDARERAFEVALRVNPEAAIEAMLAGLGTSQTAPRALDLLRRPEAVNPLLDRLTPETAPEITPVLTFLGQGLRRPPYSARDPRVAHALDSITRSLIQMLPRMARARSSGLIEALQALGEWAIDSLRQALLEAHGRERVPIAWALSQLEWTPTPDEAGARYWIALGQLDRCAHIGKKAIAPLLEELTGGDLDRRDASATVLRRLGWRPRNGETRLLTLIALHRWEVLRLMGETAVPALVAALADERKAALRDVKRDHRAEIRTSMVEVLGQTGGLEVAWAMVEVLRVDPSPIVRRAARLALERLGADGLAALTQALQVEFELALSLSPDQRAARDRLRREMVRTLGHIGSLDTLDVLLRVVSRDPAPTVRAAASEAIERLSVGASDQVIEAALASLDEGATPELGRVLLRLGQPAVRCLLASITGSDGSSLRRAAAGFVAMGQAGEDVASLLRGLLLSGSAETRRAVAQVLDRLDAVPDAPGPRAAYWLAKGEVERCEALGDAAIPVLIQALSIYDWREAGALALSLVRIGVRPDDPALELTMARLRLMSELADEQVTQMIEVIDEGNRAQQPVTLLVSHREERRAARKLLAAIDRSWAERLRRIKQEWEW